MFGLMFLFHSAEYSPAGLDTEFAIPVQEYVTGTRDFCPGLCLKTVVRGAYSELSLVYTKQIEWAEKEGFQNTNALFEVYITDRSLQCSCAAVLQDRLHLKQTFLCEVNYVQSNIMGY